jgi:ubiquinone/menaquinone biosynthesis C-methylase UbiE
MSHSVKQHLAVTPEEYDAEIRRFVFGYEEMLGEITTTLTRLHGEDATIDVLDLGAGTGALASRVAACLPRARLTLLDADGAMLARARLRLDAQGVRARFVQASFADALPSCDAALASLSLHHVGERAAKEAVYANVRRSLQTGGVLLSADVTMPRCRALAKLAYARWAAHLVAHGDTETQAYGRFEDWSKEDRYFPLEDEIAMMRAAGFATAEILWRRGPSTVLVATVR